MALIDGCTGYWNLDETGGSTATDSAGSNHGTLVGVSRTASGKIDRACVWDADDEYIILPPFGLAATASSLSYWFYQSARPDNYQMSFGDHNSSSHYVQHINNGTEITVGSPPLGASFTCSSMPTGSWYHVVITRDSNDTRLYLNTTESATGPIEQTGSVTFTRIGRYLDFSDYGWYGRLDEIGVWNKVLSSQEISDLYNGGDGLAYPFEIGETHNISLTDTATLTDSISTEHISPITHNISLTDTSSLSDSISTEKIEAYDTDPVSGKNTFYVKNSSGQWILFDQVEFSSVKKRQNQINEFEVKLFDVTTAQKAYFKEQAEVLFFSGTTMILKGRIQTIEYGDELVVIARGFGIGEAKLLDKKFIKNGDDRVEYTNTSAKTIATDINTGLDGNPILTTASSGLFQTDFGQVSLRFEQANRMKSIATLAETIDYDWWVSQTSSDAYKENFINIASYRGNTASQKTYSPTTNASFTSQERDTNNLANSITFLGYGDGVNQLKTTTFAASTQNSILNANIDSTNTSILILDASDFDATGTARIAEEQLIYAGISSNTLTGCTRGTNSTTAKQHFKNCYVEQYFPITASQTGSPIGIYGIMDDTLIERSILSEPAGELLASKELAERKVPIERIKVIPDEPLEDVSSLDIGDNITITSSESNIDGDFRIVGINYISNYGALNLELEVSNRSLEFIEQMNKQREEERNLGKYMQGSTNIYAVSMYESCDPTHYVNMRFFIPNEAVAINKVLLNFKMEPMRSVHIGGADYITIGGTDWDAEFQGATDGDNFQRLGNMVMAGDDSVTFLCPVLLPEGATVTRVVVYGNAAATAETWSLRRDPISGGGSQTLATANFDTADTSISYATVDNQNYVYFLKSSSIDSSDEIHGARIDFTTPSQGIREYDDEKIVNLYTGEDGGSMTHKAEYDSDQTELDLTTEIQAIGAGKWVNIQFRSTDKIRVEANCYIQMFIESK